MKNIVIKWAVFLTAFLISLEVSAQNVRVSGVVTDALGPIPGVNIMEEGTTNGTVTDVNGKYSISVSAKSTLVFSCIGYKEQKIRVGTKTVLNVNMVEESKMLDELVVVGYGVQRKSDVATSVASVKADEMKTEMFTPISGSFSVSVTIPVTVIVFSCVHPCRERPINSIPINNNFFIKHVFIIDYSSNAILRITLLFRSPT